MRLSRLADVQLRGKGLVFAALGVQLVLFTRLAHALPPALDPVFHVVTYGLLLSFLALNLRRSGIAIAGAGLAANTTVIAANGGRMPITLDAWVATGRPAEAIARTGYYNNNVLAGAQARLAWLGDVFALPSEIPLATAVSVGDLLILLGATAFVVHECRRNPPSVRTT